MLRTTRWHPDTCKCIFEYTWDDEIPEDNRNHNITKVISVCDAHKHLDNEKQNHFDSIVNENKLKNKVHALILENSNNLTTKIVDNFKDVKGQDNKVLKSDIYSFTFDENRKLKVNLKSISKNEKDLIQSVIDTEIGSGKVEIQNG